jgi:two-component system alkaline phosphatase synthesis response regulator PhoP
MEEAKIYIDRESFSVYVNQHPVAVSRKEFELLHLMASQPGKIFTRDEIFEKVWKRKSNPKDRTIDVHILRLRKKLGDEFISTQKGVGYRFRAGQ